jgi:hypothetical protein
MKRRPVFIIFIGLFLFQTSCKFQPAMESGDVPRGPWTVILYFGVDNYQFGTFPTDLWGLTDNLTAGASSLARPDTPILLLYDGCKKGDSKILELSSRTVIDDRGAVIPGSREVNYGDPGVMAAFIIWAAENYPADHYLLGLCHHYGWQGYNTDENSPGPMGMDIITMPEHDQAMRRVREAGIKIDVIWFEACSITMIETLYQYGMDADYVVGNQDTIDFYEEILRVPGMMAWMRNHPDASPEELARALVDKVPMITPSLITNQLMPLQYVSARKTPGGKASLDRLGSVWLPTQFAFEGSRVPAAARAVDRLAKIMEADLDRLRPAIERSRKKSKEYTLCPWYVDLYDLCRLLHEETDDPEVRAACREVMAAVEASVFAKKTLRMDRKHHGVLILFPLTAGEWEAERTNRFDPENRYADLAFAQDTRWDEFLEAYLWLE